MIQGKESRAAMIVDEFRLETIGELHAVAADIFLPFAIVRLRDSLHATEAQLAVELRDVPGQKAGVRQLRNCDWEAQSIPLLPLGIQPNPLTEWAALGVAAAVIWQYAGLRLHSVADSGDRLDYWVMRGEEEFGLEVSGTTTDDVDARHRAKVGAVAGQSVPIGWLCCCRGFAAPRVLFSFHQYGGSSDEHSTPEGH